MAEWLRRWTANPLGSARAGSNPVIVDFFRDTMAEWLRRLTRNQLGSARVGSNPTGVDLFRIMGLCRSHFPRLGIYFIFFL